MERFVSYGRRAFVILAVLALGAGVGAGSAWAAETFHGTVHISLDTSGADICDLTAGPIDESGLGNPNVTYTLSANATLGKACQNNGGNFPSDPKKNCGAGGVAGDATFAIKNGRVRNAFVTVDISQEVPVPLSCP